MNPRQDLFCREVAAGKPNAEAYLTAYPGSRKWTRKALDTRAQRLASNAEIMRKIETLRREADEAAVMQLRELRTRLTARLRAMDEEGAGAVAFARLAETYARVSGWGTPSAVALAVSGGVPLTPEDKGRRICEVLGVSYDEVKKKGHDEAWELFREAMGIRKLTEEERERRWREIMGMPYDDEPEDATPVAVAPSPSPVAFHSPRPETIEPPAPSPAEVAEVAEVPEDGDAAEREPVDGRAEVETPEPEPEPVAVEEDPARRERLARILAFVKKHGATSREDARGLALQFEGGSVIGLEATAVADAWEAERVEASRADSTPPVGEKLRNRFPGIHWVSF